MGNFGGICGNIFGILRHEPGRIRQGIKWANKDYLRRLMAIGMRGTNHVNCRYS